MALDQVEERYLFFQNLFSKLWATTMGKYFSYTWAFPTQRADAKNSEKCQKKSVWATLV